MTGKTSEKSGATTRSRSASRDPPRDKGKIQSPNKDKTDATNLKSEDKEEVDLPKSEDKKEIELLKTNIVELRAHTDGQLSAMEARTERRLEDILTAIKNINLKQPESPADSEIHSDDSFLTAKLPPVRWTQDQGPLRPSSQPPSQPSLIEQLAEMETKMIQLKEAASANSMPNAVQLIQPAPPPPTAHLRSLDSVLGIYSHLSSMNEYSNRHAGYKPENLLMKSISVKILKHELHLGVRQHDGQVSLEGVTESQILAAIYKTSAWKIQDSERFIDIVRSYPFKPRKEVADDTVTGPEDIVAAQTWLSEINSFYAFLKKIVESGAYRNAIPDESTYRHDDKHTMKSLMYVRLNRHFPWFRANVWTKVFQCKSPHWLDVHSVLDSGLEEVKLTMQKGFAINLACSSARIRNQMWVRDRTEAEDKAREAARAEQPKLLARPAGLSKGTRPWDAAARNSPTAPEVVAAIYQHDQPQYRHAPGPMVADSDDETEQEEAGSSTQHDTIGAAIAHDELNALQAIGNRDTTQQRTAAGASQVNACYHTFLNGTPCPKAASGECHFDHSREAMLAKARQLGYMDDSGHARRSPAAHTHPWDAAGSAVAPKAKQM